MRFFFGRSEAADHRNAGQRETGSALRHGGARTPWLLPFVVMLLVPALTLAASLIDIGPGAPMLMALLLAQTALLVVLLRGQGRWPRDAGSRPDAAPPTRVAQPRDAVEALLNSGRQPALQADDGPGRDGAALVARLDDADRLRGHHGAEHLDALMQTLAERLGAALRSEDAFCHLPPDGFAIALQPRSGLDVSTVLAVAWRLQAQLGIRFKTVAATTWPSVSIGLCTSAEAAQSQGLSMIAAAERAAEWALRAGPGGLHSFSAIDAPGLVSCDRREDLQRAIEAGEICAHFQPQIDAASGAVSGLEALARWQHPERGTIPPGEFLPQIERAGLSPLLARRIRDCALSCLARLDAVGLAVPAVAINLSMTQLRNPRLADEIAWALDLHELSPERLVIEILEDVIADGDDDIMVRNVARLAAMGCGIDLDDFGTGHASIASIRRFAVGRLKIDRSFITNLHRDGERHRMAGAIMTMAAGLGLDTVAEGVETAEEMAILAAMGCTHLQGFAIARPMPEAELLNWFCKYAAKADQLFPGARATGQASMPANVATITHGGPARDSNDHVLQPGRR